MPVSVLLVEDSPMISRMYGRYFTAQGFTLHTAADGLMAVAQAKAVKPSLIIMDVMMPNMNGMEALEIIKQDPETAPIPVIMLSAYDDDTQMQQAIALGAKRYLLKGSVEPEAIVQTAKDVLMEMGYTFTNENPTPATTV